MSENNSDEEFITIDKILENQPKDKTVFNFSNFNDVIREDYIFNKDNENIENIDKYFYQPQFKDMDDNNICNFKIVGYNEKGKKPEVRMGEFVLLNDKWLVISHLYNIFELNNVYDFKKRFFDIFSIVLNRDDLDIILSLRYIVNTNIEKYKFKGKFIIIFRYKKSNEQEELLKIKEIDNFPGFNKSIEFLIKELSNPNIIENYEW
jgi:hypothetical protein